MPVTRSVSSRRKAVEKNIEATEPPHASETAFPAEKNPSPCPSVKYERSIQAQSVCSSKGVLRATAVKRLAQARLEVARAAAELAEAEIADLDAQINTGKSVMSNGKSLLVESWLKTQPKVEPPTERDTGAPHHHHNINDQTYVHHKGVNDHRAQLDVTTLAAALTEAMRASHAPTKLQELPNFGGVCSEWLAFRAAYRDTNHHFTKVENLARLRRCLRGAAKEAAISLFVAETDPDEVMRLLEVRFGRPDALVIAEMEKIKMLPRITDNPRDICIFASRISNIVAVVRALHRTYYLYNPEAVRTVVDRMTPALKYRWYDFAAERPEDEPDLIKLNSFVSREAELCSRYAQAESVPDHTPSPQKKAQRTYAITPSQSSSSSSANKAKNTPKCPVCESEHNVRDCTRFKDLIVSDRWKLAKENNICFRCLNKRNYNHRCRYKACRVEGCEGSHHPLLHSTNTKTTTETETPIEPAVVTAARPQTLERALLKVIPVRIRGPIATLDTFALLDEGSTVTLVEDKVAEIVGATGPREPFEIEGVAGARVSAKTSMRVSLNISGRYGDKEHEFIARTIDQLHLSPQTIDTNIIEKCTYLNEIAQDLTYHRGTPTLLIGQDNWNLIVSRSVKSGVRGQPVASLTELGWVLHGPCGIMKHRVHMVTKVTVHNNDEDERIEIMMKNFFDLDGIGIEPRRPKNDPNERALAILKERSRRLPDGRFETALLWRNEKIELPNNRDSAMRRLEGIERKLDKNIELKKQYKDQMSYLLESGYAEITDTAPRPGRTWYLPHFAVVSPSKPKPRIVLDAAAKTQGVSLNDMLLTGPDLLQLLPGVLMRFRQRCVAVIGDIKEMFLRISMREEDRDALRFLWRDDRREGPPTEYRMRSVIFGAASSPCTAIYIKNRNAEEYRQQFPEAADAICRNHYMDDYLQSFDSTEQAIRIASNVDHVHRQAQFHLRKWASNRPEVLEAISPGEKCPSDDVELQNSPTLEKTLGLVWRSVDDHLAFNLDLKRVEPDVADGTKRPTKREALRAIMSLFDPLGLVTPVTMPAKRLLQDTWRLGVGWDDELPDDMHLRWLEWLSHMKQLRHLTIERCYPQYATAVHLEMHIFVDASEAAYVAAVFWRAVTESATVHLSLVMAKGKVAPLKTTSIPRLELQAAVLGCRLARTVEAEHDIKPARRVFWTDSRTVLVWLRAGPRTYKPFVAHRVAEVEEESKVSEWRWLPSALNVADDATRGTPSGFGRDHRWFRGPDFLYHSEESWPREPEPTQLPVTGEERVATTTCGLPRFVHALPEAARFSSWLRLVRATGRVLQFIELCRAERATTAAGTIKRTRRSEDDNQWRPSTSRQPNARRRSPLPTTTTTSNYICLESHHLREAEKLWWKAVQEESFERDLYRLRRGLPIERESKLRELSVILDSENVIRLKSRIDPALHISEEQRNPPVLDGDNAYTKLYIAWVHKQNHHAGTETVINEIRSRLWVLRLRPTARSIVKSCIKCRILRAKPASPATGDHPSTRLAHHQRPFTYVGLDYFGPCSVTVGRRHEKRYVALFTCLTTRAVHLEIAGSLSADSAIMALRRMMARRGCPTEIHSDNATNFRASDIELRKAAYQAAKDEATSHAIRWRYIPPGSPFMGGAWERLVQSVKRALSATLNERHPTEEVLLTLLLEAEYTVNNRPLTPVSTSADDAESLTPLHFILGGPGRVPQPGSFSESDLNARQRWRHTQRLADMFWARWIKEYMPLLQHRPEPQSRGRVPEIGDVVLLIDENLPRNTWARGKITATFPGKDGIVRVVEVRVKSGLLRRAVKKIVVLAK